MRTRRPGESPTPEGALVSEPDFDVVVVGAGYAGITAAATCATADCPSLFWRRASGSEAEPILLCLRGDELIEHGAQWVNQSVSHTMRREIQRYDIETVADAAPESVTFLYRWREADGAAHSGG